MQISGAVAVVVGGGGSIGREIRTALETAGATPVPWDLSPAAGVIVCNVSDSASVDAAMEQTVREYGPPTILVNTVAIPGRFATLASEADDDTWHNVLGASDQWRATFDTNVIGPLNTSRAFARRLTAERRPGAIVNVSSVSGGPVAEPGLAAYCGSKAALNMLTRTAAADLAPLGIRVNAVAPGMMAVGMTPPGSPAPTTRPPGFVDAIGRNTPIEHRLGEAADVAQAVLAVLTMDWVTGQVIVADGGLTLTSPVPKPSKVVQQP
jgi:NAD(P)-dependent dehydrogenase (short-subunit alcohol dehydrogenase family)